MSHLQFGYCMQRRAEQMKASHLYCSAANLDCSPVPKSIDTQLSIFLTEKSPPSYTFPAFFPSNAFLHSTPSLKQTIFLKVISDISITASLVKNPWCPETMTLGKVIKR